MPGVLLLESMTQLRRMAGGDQLRVRSAGFRLEHVTSCKFYDLTGPGRRSRSRSHVVAGAEPCAGATAARAASGPSGASSRVRRAGDSARRHRGPREPAPALEILTNTATFSLRRTRVAPSDERADRRDHRHGRSSRRSPPPWRVTGRGCPGGDRHSASSGRGAAAGAPLCGPAWTTTRCPPIRHRGAQAGAAHQPELAVGLRAVDRGECAARASTCRRSSRRAGALHRASDYSKASYRDFYAPFGRPAWPVVTPSTRSASTRRHSTLWTGSFSSRVDEQPRGLRLRRYQLQGSQHDPRQPFSLRGRRRWSWPLAAPPEQADVAIVVGYLRLEPPSSLFDLEALGLLSRCGRDRRRSDPSMAGGTASSRRRRRCLVLEPLDRARARSARVLGCIRAWRASPTGATGSLGVSVEDARRAPDRRRRRGGDTPEGAGLHLAARERHAQGTGSSSPRSRIC